MDNEIENGKFVEPNRWSRDEYEYILKIYVDRGDEEVSFDLAMSLSSGLKISTERTPFECTFKTSQYYIFYEAEHRRSRVTSEIWGDEFGEYMKIGGAAGSGRAKHIKDPILRVRVSGGGGY